MAVGVGIFGILTGFLANAFVNPPGQAQSGQDGESGERAPEACSTGAGADAGLKAGLAESWAKSRRGTRESGHPTSRPRRTAGGRWWERGR